MAKGGGHRGPGSGPGGDGRKDAPGMFWERGRVAEALSLTETEKTKLTELYNDHRSAVGDLKKDLREQRQALEDIIRSEDFSTSEAKQHFESAEKIRSRLHEERFELQIEQREILGQERFVKLLEMKRRAVEKRRGKP